MMPRRPRRDSFMGVWALKRMVVWLLAVPIQPIVHAWQQQPSAATLRRHHPYHPGRAKVVVSSFSSSSTSIEDALDLERFQRAIARAKHSSTTTAIDPTTTPQEVVTRILEGLRRDDGRVDYLGRPRPHDGVVQLLERSTESWQVTLATAVGGATSTPIVAEPPQEPPPNNNIFVAAAKHDDNDETPALLVAAALGRYLSRPGQQFAILMGVEDVDYIMDFPTDVVEWSDDECWLECRLRAPTDHELLVVLGWTLQRREPAEQKDDADDDTNNTDTVQPWLIHAMDWQDFRDPYRPGIGREEWERICG